MKNYKLTFSIIFTFILLQLSAQEKNGLDTWSVGAGLSNTLIHGDLTSINNLDKHFFNGGFYVYIDKMFSSKIGIEVKGQSLSYTGYSQELSSGYPIENTNYNNGNLYFEGDSFGGELNLIINLNGFGKNPYAKKDRKFNFATYLGVGYHSYHSELFAYSDLNGVEFSYTDTNTLNKKSIYFTGGIGARYFLNNRIDLELRQNFNFNQKDDLDAAITKKQVIEAFFTTQLGIVVKLYKKEHKNIVWDDKALKIKEKKDTDSDGDGVMDRFDVEENTPLGAKVYFNGRAVDSDKDGIIDFYDKCRLTAGIKDNNGCPIDKKKDTDEDGVPDYLDKEKNSPKGAKVDFVGVAIDTDKDGIIDFFDKCPNLKGLEDLEGCPVDTDKDGIYDINDLCPNIPGNPENKGCPNPMSEKDNTELLRLAKNIYFESGKFYLRESSKRELEQVAEIMKKNPGLKFVIEGHTDSGGKKDYNVKLSQERANAVRKYLIFLDVEPSNLKAIGYGFSRPKYTNTSYDGRQLNRRVEIKVDDSSLNNLINSNTHLIEKEDTLFSIAEKYHVSIEQLKEWNNLKNNTIIIGDRLIIKKD